MPLLWASACGPGVVRLELPDRPGARSIIAGVRHNEQLQVSAIDLEADPTTWSLPSVDPRTDEARFFAQFYSEPLSELSLEPGLLRVLVEGRTPPEPDLGTYERGVGTPDDPDWIEVDRLRPELQFSLPKIEGPTWDCPTLQVTRQSFGERGRIMAAIPERGGTLFVVNEGGQGFRVRETEITPLGEVVPDIVFSGVQTSSGTVWLAGGDGRLWTGTPQAGFASVPAREHGESFRYFATQTALDARPELFGLTRQGTLDRLGPDGVWRSQELVADAVASDRGGGLVWLAEDLVGALVPGSGTYFRVDKNVVDQTVVLSGDLGDLSTIGVFDGQTFGVSSTGAWVRMNILRDYSYLTALPDMSPNPQLVTFGPGFLMVGGPSYIRLVDFSQEVICGSSRSYAGQTSLWASAVVNGAAYLFMSPTDDWESAPPEMLVVKLPAE